MPSATTTTTRRRKAATAAAKPSTVRTPTTRGKSSTSSPSPAAAAPKAAAARSSAASSPARGSATVHRHPVYIPMELELEPETVLEPAAQTANVRRRVTGVTVPRPSKTAPVTPVAAPAKPAVTISRNASPVVSAPPAVITPRNRIPSSVASRRTAQALLDEEYAGVRGTLTNEYGRKQPTSSPSTSPAAAPIRPAPVTTATAPAVSVSVSRNEPSTFASRSAQPVAAAPRPSFLHRPSNPVVSPNYGQHSRPHQHTVLEDEDDADGGLVDADELRALQEEFLQGRTETLQEFRKLVSLVDSECVELDQRIQQLREVRRELKAEFDRVNELNPENWDTEDIIEEMNAALGVISKSQRMHEVLKAKVERLLAKQAPPPQPLPSPAKPGGDTNRERERESVAENHFHAPASRKTESYSHESPFSGQFLKKLDPGMNVQTFKIWLQIACFVAVLLVSIIGIWKLLS